MQEHIYLAQAMISDSPTWVDELVDYISSDILLEDKDKARQIRKHKAWYTMLNNISYHHSFSKPLLHCISPSLTRAILEELHEGVRGGHPVSRPLAEKLIN